MTHILVQNGATKHFLAAGEQWTSDAAEAREFEHSLNAIAHCLLHDLGNTQVVVKSDEPGACDVMVPI